jgi:hypothetical protein
MIRKQIYVEKRQQALLRRAAQSRGVSEAEVIRQAIDRQVQVGIESPLLDPEAWSKARRFMAALQRRKPAVKHVRQWKRDDAYGRRR